MGDRKLILAVVLSGLVVVFFGVVMPMITGQKDAGGDRKGAERKGGEEPTIRESREAEQDGAEGSDAGNASDADEALQGGAAAGAKLSTRWYDATLSSRGGVVAAWLLKGERYVRDTEGGGTTPIDMVRLTTGAKPHAHLTFRATWSGGEIPTGLEYETRGGKNGKVLFTARTAEWLVERTLRSLDTPYEVEAVTRLTNVSGRKLEVTPRVAVRLFRKIEASAGILGFLKPIREKLEGMCSLDGDLKRQDLKKLQSKGGIDRIGNVGYVAVADHYFVSALTPAWDLLPGSDQGGAGKPEARCLVKADAAGVVTGTLDFGKTEVEDGETIVMPARAFIGPKEYETLKATGLGTAIDYGWFGALARFLYVVLRTFQGWTGNWAIAIIFLTISVKLVLAPLTHWSFKSMQKMQGLKPLIDDLNRKYPEPEDKEKKSKELMRLYSTHKINPFTGCFPMLLQMPIWISLYRMLGASVELYRTPLFLWIKDMSQPDPWFVLPIVLGGSMFAQQKLTPTTADAQQAKMMLWMMPIMFTVFMLFLPAGLCLYILVNTVLTVAQQQLLYRPKALQSGTKSAASVTLMSEMDPAEVEARRRGRKDGDGPARKGGKEKKR